MTSHNQGLPSLAPWDVKRRDLGRLYVSAVDFLDQSIIYVITILGIIVIDCMHLHVSWGGDLTSIVWS